MMDTTPLKIKTASENADIDFSLGKLLDQPNGFQKIASEKLPVFIREVRDYESFARSVLVAHNISRDQVQIIGNEPFFPYVKDLNSHAAIYADDTMIPRLQIEGEVVNVPISTISSDDTTISIRRLMIQRYNYLDRVRTLSGQTVAMIEDRHVLNLMETLLQGRGTEVEPEHADQIIVAGTDKDGNVVNELSKKDLVRLRKVISQNDIPVSSFLMHKGRIEDVLLWGQADIDQLTQREMLETGAKYAFFGTKILVSRIIDKNTVYVFAEPEYVGRMPIFKDLTTMLTDTPNKLEKGLFMWEMVGFYLASHKAIGKLLLNYTDGDPKIKLYDLQNNGMEQKQDDEGALERPVGFGALEENHAGTVQG